ncbi:hypothetical protein GCM10007301_37820 [Azorhizobium oxalatiphilum]|uniref:TonB C-terminal domain-containing protein n=1 Tax=Azorhizobium oxalatiphilum TaxID=980631 RepID=A0A917FGR9_9HYPH|nr:energy transducer TonB [Azorhizobium oxalatiphilum]GGF74428.1 hypothetical protein GCM10007301_37820 [Azorhizobium oxalatiphilum]
MTAIHPEDHVAQDHHHHDHRLAYIAGWWLLAGALIFAAHAGLVYAALHWHKPISAADEAAAAVMIELAPIATAPPSQTEDVAPGPEMVQAPEPIPDAPEMMEEAEPPPAPEVVEEQPPIEKLPDLPPPPPIAEAVLPTPRPVIPDPPPPEKRKPEPKKERKASRRPAAPVTSAAPRSDAQEAAATAAPSQGDSASRSQQRADWASLVSGRLNRFKRYPPGASERGVAQVRFSMDRSGNVLSSSLVRSSGSAALDAEAVELPRRASPFPPPLSGGTQVLTVPINFNGR